MKYKFFNYILLLLISFSFIAPYFSAYAYKFCPSNPENGFICYCIYKDTATTVKDADDLIYSSAAKKQIDLEKFSSLTLFWVNQYELIDIDSSTPEKVSSLYNLSYISISPKVPDKPPTVS